LDFDIAVPSLPSTMPCVNIFAAGSSFAIKSRSRITFVKNREDQVQNCVRDAADVLIDLEPLRDLRGIERGFVIVRVAVR